MSFNFVERFLVTLSHKFSEIFHHQNHKENTFCQVVACTPYDAPVGPNISNILEQSYFTSEIWMDIGRAILNPASLMDNMLDPLLTVLAYRIFFYLNKN